MPDKPGSSHRLPHGCPILWGSRLTSLWHMSDATCGKPGKYAANLACEQRRRCLTTIPPLEIGSPPQLRRECWGEGPARGGCGPCPAPFGEAYQLSKDRKSTRPN